jgi:hypothetical protein
MLVLAERVRSTYAMVQVRGRYKAGTSDTARSIVRSVTAYAFYYLGNGAVDGHAGIHWGILVKWIRDQTVSFTGKNGNR